jgi:hypothetical protein
MRTLSLLALAALLAACASSPPPRAYAPDPLATERFEKGLATFASAETAAVPSEAWAAALPDLAAAAKRVPSPEHRFAHARTALLLDPDDADARTELASCVEEAPDEPRILALSALILASDALRAGNPSGLDAAAERAEKALTIAAVVSAREIRCFVGDQACYTATYVQRKDIVRAANLIVPAASLGSPWALMNEAHLHWQGRRQTLDWKKAFEETEAAYDLSFTPAEIGRGLLEGISAAKRRAARELGHMHVEQAEFAEAHLWLERGLGVLDDLRNAAGDPDRAAVLALAERGAIEALALDGDATNAERGRYGLKVAGELGFLPAVLLRARVDAAEREGLLATARKAGSPGAYAALGDFTGLADLASKESATRHEGVEKLVPLRLAFFAKAALKGGSVRVETEKAAREAVEGAPESMTLARQFRHIAGDLSAADLQATMPKSAHVPRWRAETELALATRCLIVADKPGAREHLENVLRASCLFSIEDEVAWGALRSLK